MTTAEVLAAHQWRGEILGCGCRWNWPEDRTHFCGEEERIEKTHIAHQLDALKAAGYVVVELPKPDAGTRKLGWEWDTPDVFSVYAGGSAEPFSGGVTINDFGQRVTITSAEARHAARCLLAAADAAEAAHG